MVFSRVFTALESTGKTVGNIDMLYTLVYGKTWCDANRWTFIIQHYTDLVEHANCEISLSATNMEVDNQLLAEEKYVFRRAAGHFSISMIVGGKVYKWLRLD